MPYSSISSAPASFRRLAATAGGSIKVPLSLAQINYIARVYDGLVSRGRSKTQAAALAVGRFRSGHKVTNGRWIKKHDDIEYGVTKYCDLRFDSPFAISKHYQEGEGDEEKWYLEGIAVIDKLDYQDDVVSPEAMRTAAADLEKNTTVLYNHDNNQEVGTVVEYAFLGDSIFIKVLVSKTRPDIWIKVQEGTLRKFSIRGHVLAFDIRYVTELNKAIRYIKAMTINEVSIVTVSAQADAEAFSWYVKGVDEPVSYHIEKAFRLQRGGDSTMAKKAHKQSTTVPGFTIVSNEKGQQVITLQVPKGLEKSDVVPDLDLDDIEKVAKAAQVKLDEIITAAEEAMKSEDKTVKAWAGKVLEAAKALKDNKFVPDEDDDTATGDEDGTKKSTTSDGDSEGQTIQIVLPGEAKPVKKDDPEDDSDDDTTSDDDVKITAEDLAKADFQSCVLKKMQGGMDMTKAAHECKCEMAKAAEAVSSDESGVVKMLLERLMQRDDVNTVLQSAVVKIAETVGGQTKAINDLTDKVKLIPVRKGLNLTEDQIETERDKLQKKLEDKDPSEQLRILLEQAIGDTTTKTT